MSGLAKLIERYEDDVKPPELVVHNGGRQEEYWDPFLIIPRVKPWVPIPRTYIILKGQEASPYKK